MSGTLSLLGVERGAGEGQRVPNCDPATVVAT